MWRNRVDAQHELSLLFRSILEGDQQGERRIVMRIHYQLHPLTPEDRQFCYYVLMDEMDRQVWYGILVSSITHNEELICVQ